MKTKNTLTKIAYCLSITTFAFLTSCSADEVSPVADEVSPVEEAHSEGLELTARASNGSFDFSHFDGETSSTSGASISKRAYFNPSTTDNTFYFDKNASNQRVFKCYRADSNRTELKEKSGKESSLNTSKDMEYIAKLENIPENGVTVAQVHNRGTGVKRPLLRIYVENGRFKMKKTKNSPTASSGTYDSVVNGPIYKSGTTFTLRVRFSNGKVLVNISTTSSTMSTKTFTPSSDWNGVSSKYYLKAGVYTEGNDKEPKLTMFGFDK
jgi:hypothetical protein